MEIRPINIKAIASICLILALVAAHGGQVKTPPIAQLVQSVDDRAGPVSYLSARIDAAFDASHFGDWFAVPKDGSSSTATDDTIHLIRSLRLRVESATTQEMPAYRLAWRTLCRRVFALRVPPPKRLGADVGDHLDYPTSTQELSLVQIVTYLLESSVELWLTLDLGPTPALAVVMKSTAAAQELRTVAESANDRVRLGDVDAAYTKIVATCEDLTVSMGLAKP